MTAVGWYPDPDDPNARRYWDGQTWSAPLPKTTPEPKPADGSCADSSCGTTPPTGFDRCYEHMTREQRVEVIRSDDPAVRAAASEAWRKNRPAVFQGEQQVSAGGRAQIICPHCQVRGRVTSQTIKQKKGVSGAKATGAVLTAGISLLGTGLSRKETVTEMHCRNCGTVWTV